MEARSESAVSHVSGYFTDSLPVPTPRRFPEPSERPESMLAIKQREYGKATSEFETREDVLDAHAKRIASMIVYHAGSYVKLVDIIKAIEEDMHPLYVPAVFSKGERELEKEILAKFNEYSGHKLTRNPKGQGRFNGEKLNGWYVPNVTLSA